jgi:hypothetical protein
MGCHERPGGKPVSEGIRYNRPNGFGIQGRGELGRETKYDRRVELLFQGPFAVWRLQAIVISQVLRKSSF